MDKVIKYLKKHVVAKYGEIEGLAPSKSAILRSKERGEIQLLGAGVYAHASVDPFHASLLAVSKFFPRTTISNLTALSVYGFSDERVDRVDVDIPREHSIRNNLVRAHRVPRKRIIGVQHLALEIGEIRIYDRERTLCEAFFIDPNGHIFFKAIKRYCKQGNVNPELIAKYDDVLGCSVLKSYLQEIADG